MHLDEGPPAFRAPPRSCDAHFHVFGPGYPAGTTDLRYALPHAPLDAYRALAATLGIERMVFVQPSAYGRDNRCMLDAMREVGVAHCRGIVDVAEDIADAELQRLHALGVRGVRINVSPVKPFEAGFAAGLVPRIRALDERLSAIGWHLDFLLPGWLTDALWEELERLRCDHTLAHFGMYLAKEGVVQPGFQRLLARLRNGNGRCWVKLTGVYRMSQAPGFADVEPFAHALIEAAPDRLIWGSDYPHLSFADKVGSIELFNLLGTWAPDAAMRHQILVANPERLFGFEA